MELVNYLVSYYLSTSTPHSFVCYGCCTIVAGDSVIKENAHADMLTSVFASLTSICEVPGLNLG